MYKCDDIVKFSKDCTYIIKHDCVESIIFRDCVVDIYFLDRDFNTHIGIMKILKVINYTTYMKTFGCFFHNGFIASDRIENLNLFINECKNRYSKYNKN